MNKSRRTRNMIIDKLHKGVVVSCIAVTLYGCSVLGMEYYSYVTQRKPLAAKQKLLENQNLLAEGASEVFQEAAPPLPH